MRILIIEDEKKVTDFLKRGLNEEGFTVDVAEDGELGKDLAASGNYNIVILDLMLPKKDGLTVCRELRAEKVQTSVLMLTAKDSIESRVEGLNCGADDYLTKPFAFTELLARIRALSRRSAQARVSLRLGELTMDPLKREVVYKNSRIDLTNKEFVLLELFLKNPDKVLSRTVISENLWEEYDGYSNIVDVHINHLRTKIKSASGQKCIHTVHGVGYVIKAEQGF